MEDVNRENLARMIAQQKAALAAMEAVMNLDERPDPGSTTTTGQPNPLFAGLRSPSPRGFPDQEHGLPSAPVAPSLATQPVDRTIGLAPPRWPDDPPELTPPEMMTKRISEFPPIKSVGQHASGITIEAGSGYIDITPNAITNWREIMFRPGMAAAMLYVLMPVVEEVVAATTVGDASRAIDQLQTWNNLTVAQRVALTDLFRWVDSQLEAERSVIPSTVLANMAAASNDYETGLQ